MSYYDHYPNLSRRPSFHGSVHGDYHHSSYDDTYGARQPFGEVNNHHPSSVRPKLGGPDGHIPRQPYQQFPGQAPFPGYNPPLAHQQQFPISREPQSSDFYPPDGNPHSFVASPPEPVHTVPSVSRRPSWNAGVDPRARRRDHQPNRSFSGMPTSEYPPPGPAHNPQRVSPPAHIPPPSQMHPMPSSPDFPPPPGPPYMSRTASRHDTEYPHMQHPGSRPIPGPGPPPHTIRRVKSLSGRDFPHSHDEILGGGFGSGAHGLDAPHSFRPPPAYADSYEDSPLTEPAYFEGVERGRTLSTGYHNGPVMAPPLASYPSKLYRSRSRRASTPGPYTAVPVPMAPMSAMEPYTQRTGASIMFKLKGGYSEGISLSDAMADARLSRSCQYSFHQLHLGLRGRLTMRVRWNGYRSLNYEIPVTGYDGLVNMQSFARRLARGVVHYLQTNGITIPWDRVVLHRLDEETHGLWVPILTTI